MFSFARQFTELPALQAFMQFCSCLFVEENAMMAQETAKSNSSEGWKNLFRQDIYSEVVCVASNENWGPNPETLALFVPQCHRAMLGADNSERKQALCSSYEVTFVRTSRHSHEQGSPKSPILKQEQQITLLRRDMGGHRETCAKEQSSLKLCLLLYSVRTCKYCREAHFPP